jgi:hypothetical protein
MYELTRILWYIPNVPTEQNIKQLQHWFSRRSRSIEILVAKNIVTISSYRQIVEILGNQNVSEIILPYDSELFNTILVKIGIVPIYLNQDGDIMPYLTMDQRIDYDEIPYAQKTRAKKSELVATQRNIITFRTYDEIEAYQPRGVTIQLTTTDSHTEGVAEETS